MSTETHAPGRLDHSLCGLAPEAFETGFHDAPVVFVERGQEPTCLDCRREIDWVRNAFRGYRYRGTDHAHR